MTVHDRHTVHFDPLDAELAQVYADVTSATRARCPVAWSDGHWSPERTGFWLVTGYQEVKAAATDPGRFISGEGAVPVQFDLDVVRLVPLENDEPLHKQIRNRLNPFFIPLAINNMQADVERLVEEILDDCLHRDPCDMVTGFATVLPPRVLFELVLHQDPKQLHHIFEMVDIMQTHPERALEVAPGLFEWCAALLESARGEDRRDDLIGTIAHMGQPDDEFQLTEKDRLDMMYLMVVAGIDTTQSALGQMFYEVARDQDLRRGVASMDDEQLGHAVEEVLRYTSPVTLAGRTVAEDTGMAGCIMGQGDRVNLSWIGANRDPTMFPDPEQINVERSNAKWHLSFGTGIHTCLGNHLARRELRLALQAVSRLTRFELADENFRPTYRAGFTRGPIELPVHLAR